MSTRRTRKGNAAYTALTCITLLGFATLAVDVGHARKAKAELQNASDAASLAGVAYINGTSAGITAAEAMAIAVGNANFVNGAAMDFTAADVEFGEWDGTNFTVSGVVEDINAIRVLRANHQIDTIFGLAAFGQSTMGAGASSIAIRPPPTPATAVSCYLPVAVPSCRVMDQVDTNGDGVYNSETDDAPTTAIDFVASGNNGDNAAWASLTTSGSANASFIMNQFDPAAGACEGASLFNDDGTPAEVDLNNGNLTSGYSAASDVITDQLDYEPSTVSRWDDDPGAEYWTGYNESPEWDERIYIDNEHGQDTYSDFEYTDNTGNSKSWETDAEANPAWGRTIQGPIMLVSGPDTDGDGVDDFCDTDNPANFTGNHTLVGFAWGAIYDVSTRNGNSMNIRINVDFDFDEYSTAGGGTTDVGLVFYDSGVIGQ